MEASGVKLDLELTMFYQGLASGTGSQDFEFGSRLDGFVKLDTGKMGLWKGGGLVSHLEYRAGDLPGALGGTFFPTNSGMEFPSDSPEELVATSLYLSQRFGDRTSLLLGKINALDLVESDLFFGGWGNHRFMNAVFAAPPAGWCRRCSSAGSAVPAGRGGGVALGLRPHGSYGRLLALTTCSTRG